MSLKSTQELRDIWIENDRDTWSEDAFHEIRDILQQRGEPLPDQKQFVSEGIKSYEGIGGWLILPIIGLFVTPIRMLILVFNDLVPIFTEGHWSALTIPGNVAYHPLWAPLIIFEVVGNVVFIIASMVLLVLFFSKSRLVPKLMISYLILNALFVVGDFFFADLIPAVAEQNDPGSAKELARTIVGAMIWIPYFLVSKRVKATFVR